MYLGTETSLLNEEYPRRADLRKELRRPLPFIPPGTVDPAVLSGEEINRQALAVVEAFDNALSTNDTKGLASCFLDGQPYWRDILALTSHLRTFTKPGVIVPALLETKNLRGVKGGLKFERADFVPATPVLQFIDCRVTFKTTAPAATCSGRLILLPIKVEGRPDKEILSWKIWILSTWIDNLDVQAEDENLLRSPGRNLDDLTTIETDVLIVGGGNSGTSIAARLKALGVESVILDRNPRVGDNWAFRYDCVRFHLPAAACAMPYLPFKKEWQTPHLLKRDELADHLIRYAAEFDLNYINSMKIQTTTYDQVKKRWTIQFETPNGVVKAIGKQLVQSTGFSASKPYRPPMLDVQRYRGINIHSAEFKNAQLLKNHGAKSVVVIGSANTAFDVIEDCNRTGLKTTIVARSPTYILPVDYVRNAQAMGLYDHVPIENADKHFLTLPNAVESQITHGLLARLASEEPNRYESVAATGFPVLVSSHPDASLQHHLLERGGGHYVDVGGAVELLTEGKVGVKGGVSPVAYTATGLRFSDGTTIDTDAVIWCTGFADKDARSTAADIFGGSDGQKSVKLANGNAKDVLGPLDIADRLDTTFALDAEGEVRGFWKRHLRMENYWAMGGHMQLQRWWSGVLAQQIKMAVEGILPPPYLDTPESVKQL
ncbi:FAD/NAD(P)-binding domain-containing protein [Hypoxylon trugodes]|uniref:FAD/NAD(P)-binding domain-containing protein n=1 Tax=Hypoxylon trugodes TaxID=326681 RepID=UPI0021949462|nr:FAD/NAD(P)-binding domain-containing protein [Hypoxylon trugodes]KAI1383771.1 FAD/NAD(P)-binding domain-containing protein [Hypoxylon trugodes]